jgi:hypothetical protein
MSDVRFIAQVKNAKQKFIKLIDNVEDMSPVFKEFLNEYKEIIAQNFESRGKIMERERWAQYTPIYLAWKQKHFPGKPMLEITGDLKNAALNFQSQVGQKTLMMKVEGADYFYYVQERQTNPRHYFNTKDNDLPIQAWRILIERTEKHIMDGVE